MKRCKNFAQMIEVQFQSSEIQSEPNLLFFPEKQQNFCCFLTNLLLKCLKNYRNPARTIKSLRFMMKIISFDFIVNLYKEIRKNYYKFN